MSVPFRKRNLAQGEAAEKEFITLRGDNFVRRANSLEDMNEHWVRPLPEETPDPKFEDHKQFFHEGGCYW